MMDMDHLWWIPSGRSRPKLYPYPYHKEDALLYLVVAAVIALGWWLG